MGPFPGRIGVPPPRHRPSGMERASALSSKPPRPLDGRPQPACPRARGWRKPPARLPREEARATPAPHAARLGHGAESPREARRRWRQRRGRAKAAWGADTGDRLSRVPPAGRKGQASQALGGSLSPGPVPGPTAERGNNPLPVAKGPASWGLRVPRSLPCAGRTPGASFSKILRAAQCGAFLDFEKRWRASRRAGRTVRGTRCAQEVRTWTGSRRRRSGSRRAGAGRR